jgi:uncharacterized protein (TIRG00374 family)
VALRTVGVTGAQVSLAEAFAAWALIRIITTVPLTPGGLGVVEGVLVPTLVGFDTPQGVAILGVLAYRLVSFWLPIPIGFGCYARLEWELSGNHRSRAPAHTTPPEA